MFPENSSVFQEKTIMFGKKTLMFFENIKVYFQGECYRADTRVCPEPHTYTIETTHSNQQKNGAAEGFTGALPVVAVISNTIHNQQTDYQHNDI